MTDRNMEKDEIAITGIAGSTPRCDNLNQFKEAIFNSVDLVSPEDFRFKTTNPIIPKRVGFINGVEKFDAGFFGVHNEQADNMDPMFRIFLERSIEAIMDAGINPSELEGTRTGVFVGGCFSETEDWTYKKNPNLSKYGLIGCLRSSIPNRLSHFLRLNGPSMIPDTACSSSLYAFDHAVSSLRAGQCDAAIVGACQLVLHPNSTLQFARMGVLSEDGRCKVFDETANGYVRGETIGAIFLQKSHDAKRIYAKIVHTKTNSDGFKTEGVHFPSTVLQQELLEDFYTECKIDLDEITYMEAHGTGTKVGDAEEVNAIDGAIAKKRTKPLLIGSVKSNMGHPEPACGFASIAKVIVSMENACIPPNINFNKAKREITAIVDGRIQVVTKPTPIKTENCKMAISNFGFGGANVHVLLEWNEKLKKPNTQLEGLPKLVCVSGRDESKVQLIVDNLNASEADPEHIALIHNVFKTTVVGHNARGFAILSNTKGDQHYAITQYDHTKKELSVNFGSFENNWKSIAKQFLHFPSFCKTIIKINAILKPFEININDIMDSNKITKSTDTLGNFATSMGLADILLDLKVSFESIDGSSTGEIVAQYFKGTITFESATQIAYEYSKMISQEQIKNGTDKVEITNGKYTSKVDQQIILNIIKNGDFMANSNGHHVEKNELHNKIRNILSNVQGIKVDSFVTKLTSTQVPTKTLPGSILLDLSNTPKNGGSRLTLEPKKPVLSLLQALGTLYNSGYDFDCQKLYREVQFPVSRGTKMVAPLITWNHDHNWFVYSQNLSKLIKTKCFYTVSINANEEIWKYVAGHVIDGRVLFPAAGYLYIVWERFLHGNNMLLTDSELTFTNCKFIRATNVPKEGDLDFGISITKGNGNFEVFEGDSLVVTGTIALGCKENQFEEVNDEEVPLVMSKKDIYKELRLRRYNYKNEFKALERCSADATKALISFKDENWVTFIDNMLQIKILQKDTRKLYVPIMVEKITINPQKHLLLAVHNEERELMVTADTDTNIIRSGGIEIYGLHAGAIAKKKPKGEAVLEVYKFIPNTSNEISFKDALRTNVQIILENDYKINMKVVELLPESKEPISEDIFNIFSDQPLIKPDVTVVTKKTLQLENDEIEITNKEISTVTDCTLAIGYDILNNEKTLQDVFASLKPNGFILSCEEAFKPNPNVNILTQFKIETQTLVLFRKKQTLSNDLKAVNITSRSDKWISDLKDVLPKTNNIVLYSYQEPTSGILGLTNCFRREPGTENTRCFFVQDPSAPEFDLNHSFYSEQLQKNMGFNVYKNGAWGTYRHLILPPLKSVMSKNIVGSQLVKGDMSTLQWFDSPTPEVVYPDQTKVKISYSALNFKDVMLASGRIDIDNISRIQQELSVGIEFSGIEVETGRRIAGMAENGGLARYVLADSNLSFYVPDKWTLDEAATIPTVYSTCLHSLLKLGNMKKGHSVLIHSGTGGVGLAAINVALFYGCDVFTTVGTEEKRQFLKSYFPTLKDSHIGNSRDISFEQMVRNETKGRGVDIVLNSLAEEKLFASVRCLAQGGRFLEIGKFDMMNYNTLNLLLLQKSASFYGVMLDEVMGGTVMRKKGLIDLINTHIDNGCIKPLPRRVFERPQLEEAFRYLTTGKHMGKVLVQIAKDEAKTDFECTPRFACTPHGTHVILGGLGGFGLELADWLILRGAKKIVLTSRSGVKNGYQAYRIKIWEALGALVKVLTHDITTNKGCEQLLHEANALGPVESIFNLAVVLKDALFDNQTEETFKQSLAPKADATGFLDTLTRSLCPTLKNFVVFSSVSCGRGNAGQTNYGMSNSVMERIIEQRQQDGLPGLAIQWGAIGDVGIVADMQEEDVLLEIGGTLQQTITNCIEVLDIFMTQGEPVVASMVVAEKQIGNGKNDNIVEAVANLLGIKDLKIISMQATLAELGMNSISAVEIKQTMERDFEVILSAQDIRNLTFAKLQELEEARQNDVPTETVPVESQNEFGDFSLLFNMLGDESTSKLNIYKYKTQNKSSKRKTVVLFPGIEGVASTFDNMATHLDADAYGVQYNNFGSDFTIENIADALLPEIENVLTDKKFNFVVHSYGSLIGFEVAAKLEAKGYTGKIISIDTSVDFVKGVTQNVVGKISPNELETKLICYFISIMIQPTNDFMAKFKESISSCQNMNERLDVFNKIKTESVPYSLPYQKLIANGIISRIHKPETYKPSYGKLTSKIKLIQPTERLTNNYGLEEYFVNVEPFEMFDGNHFTILDNPDTVNVINNYLL